MASEGMRPPPMHEEEKKQSTLELVRGIASDSGTLVRQEVQLAKQEMMEAIFARVKAAAALGVAGVLLLAAFLFGARAAAAGLANVMSQWAAFLIVAGGMILIGGMAAVFGLMRMKGPSLAPEETQRTIKEDVEWAREQLKR
jgi:hypothetical protein